MPWPDLGRALVVSAALVMSGAAQADPQRQTLHGTWSGSQFLDGQPQCWVDEYRPDGSFRSDFLTFDGRNWQRYLEEGRWTLVNGILTIFTATVNGRPATPSGVEEVDRYVVNRLDGRSFEYTEQATNVPYRVQRAEPGTSVPSTCRP